MISSYKWMNFTSFLNYVNFCHTYYICQISEIIKIVKITSCLWNFRWLRITLWIQILFVVWSEWCVCIAWCTNTRTLHELLWHLGSPTLLPWHKDWCRYRKVGHNLVVVKLFPHLSPFGRMTSEHTTILWTLLTLLNFSPVDRAWLHTLRVVYSKLWHSGLSSAL